jgi:protein-disulfide isomerase
MSCIFTPAHRFAALRMRPLFFVVMTLAAFLGFAAGARAQFGQMSSGTRILDASALRPPAGARVAIVEFSDMECPMCAQSNPTIKAAAAQYKIPWVRHDFVLPYHEWSAIAALNARWFDLRSKALGDEYRDQVFANQGSIYNSRVLSQFTEKFAAAHHIALPFAIDPKGKLAAEVQADTDLGRRTGIDHTPTVFVVMASRKGPRYIEVEHPEQDLYRTIDQAIAETRSR